MKNKKTFILSLVLLVFLLIFIILKNPKTAIKKTYKNMIINDDNINGYTLDLRIYGTIENKKVLKIIEIKNYKNMEYLITIVENGIKEQVIETKYYSKDNKLYIINEENKKAKTNIDLKYNNPEIFLEGLLHIKKVNRKSIEKKGDKSYKVYEVEFDKKIADILFNNTDIDSFDVKNKIKGKITLDENNYVIRVIYNINNLTINANYYKINQSRELDY